MEQRDTPGQSGDNTELGGDNLGQGEDTTGQRRDTTGQRGVSSRQGEDITGQRGDNMGLRGDPTGQRGFNTELGDRAVFGDTILVRMSNSTLFHQHPEALLHPPFPQHQVFPYPPTGQRGVSSRQGEDITGQRGYNMELPGRADCGACVQRPGDSLWHTCYQHLPGPFSQHGPNYYELSMPPLRSAPPPQVSAQSGRTSRIALEPALLRGDDHGQRAGSSRQDETTQPSPRLLEALEAFLSAASASVRRAPGVPVQRLPKSFSELLLTESEKERPLKSYPAAATRFLRRVKTILTRARKSVRNFNLLMFKQRARNQKDTCEAVELLMRDLSQLSIKGMMVIGVYHQIMLLRGDTAVHEGMLSETLDRLLVRIAGIFAEALRCLHRALTLSKRERGGTEGQGDASLRLLRRLERLVCSAEHSVRTFHDRTKDQRQLPGAAMDLFRDFAKLSKEAASLVKSYRGKKRQ